MKVNLIDTQKHLDNAIRSLRKAIHTDEIDSNVATIEIDSIAHLIRSINVAVESN